MLINNGPSPILPSQPSAPAAAAAPAKTDNSGTDRVELKGTNYNDELANCKRLVANRDAAPTSEPISVSVILKDTEATPEPTAKPLEGQSAPATAAQINDIKQFAESHGLSIAGVDAESHTVKLQGNAANYEKAFGVELNNYQNSDGQTFHAYEGNLSLPKDVASQVKTVTGLNNAPVAHPQNTGFIADGTQAGMVGSKAVPQAGYDPRTVANAYNFPAGTDGTGSNIAIVELGGGYKTSDINAYTKKLGLPNAHLTDHSVDGAKNAPEGSLNGADGEVYLDVEVAAAVAPKANIGVYFAPNSEQGFIDGIQSAVKDMEKTGKGGAVSVSWGGPEGDLFTGASEQAMNDVIKDAAAHGVNVYVASGDNGSVDGAQDGKDHVDFPSASPYSTTTGGTKLEVDNSGKRTSEVGWGEIAEGQGASGGGYSSDFPEPDYQKGANIPTGGAGAQPGRGVPDFSGDAAPDSGYAVSGEGQAGAIGGTSAVAPLMSALDARLRQAAGGNIGFINPTAYAHPEAFNDVTEGNNGTYNAGPGWDAVTGLGTPDGQKLADILKAKVASETNQPSA